MPRRLCWRQDRRKLRRMDEACLVRARESQQALDESAAFRSSRTLNGVEAYVCYLDVDGFRQELYRNDAGLYDDYLRLVDGIDNLWKGWITTSDGQDTVDDPDRLLYPYLFSDSWFFATTDTSDESFRQICHAAAVLWVRTMFLKSYGPPRPGPGLIARGAIARGRVWWNPSKQIILGQPLADAYQLADSMQCYGVVIHESAESGSEEATT